MSVRPSSKCHSLFKHARALVKVTVPYFEPASNEARAEPDGANDKVYGVPLGLVLKACPDIMDFGPTMNSITSWRELMFATAQVRSYLGVSPSAYADALDVLGQEGTAVVIACMLERIDTINSPGGYLRVLTEKARAGAFSLSRLVMATMKIETVSGR